MVLVICMSVSRIFFVTVCAVSWTRSLSGVLAKWATDRDLRGGLMHVVLYGRAAVCTPGTYSRRGVCWPVKFSSLRVRKGRKKSQSLCLLRISRPLCYPTPQDSNVLPLEWTGRQQLYLANTVTMPELIMRTVYRYSLCRIWPNVPSLSESNCLRASTQISPRRPACS